MSWRACAAVLGLLLARAAFAASAAACPPTAAAPTPAAMQRAEAAAQDRGFLWRATKDGRSSYLYGTLHLGKLATAVPGPSTRQALAGSDVLALELDLLDPDIQQRLARSLRGSTERDALSDALAKRLRAQIAAACLAPAAMQGVPPLLQLATLSALAARRDGLDPAFGVDSLLGAAAHAEGKPVLSLETPEAQVALLTEFSTGEERELVEQGLADLESGRARRLLDRTAAIWAGSRIDELDTYAEWCDCMRDDQERDYMKRVLDDRNQAMAGAVERLHGEGRRLFVAVGSLHMIGPRGLPALLRTAGFELVRITPR